ncbi:FecCD family ABC transporter permease [Neomicrococcus aestuarii]|uniref:FecCD family ABC transporter permease n=1 Tax=Neomicrococcus aestuarii TaxID=556325 RepID=UPI0009FC6ED8|nr:iron ABC transporter permease [Neomicrococcus aestuarii]
MKATKVPAKVSTNGSKTGVSKTRGPRTARVAAVLSGVVVLLFFAKVLLGSFQVSFVDFWRILGGETIPGATFIVMEDRLPAAIIAILAGAFFGMSGTMFQNLLRNPLASPDVIGIGYGASAAAVAGMLWFGLQGWALAGAALAGGLAIALLIYFMANSGHQTGSRLILMGIAFAAMLQAVISYLLTRADVRTVGDALRWMIGSLNSSTWDRALLLLVALVVLVPLAALAAGKLKILELGDDVAAGLGVNVSRVRLGIVVVAVCLSSVATAITGPIAFVAFLAGPLARLMNRGASSLILSALTGGALVLLAEFVASNAFGDTQLPVGVVTGALGAPFLLWLLARSNQRGIGG